MGIQHHRQAARKAVGCIVAAHTGAGRMEAEHKVAVLAEAFLDWSLFYLFLSI